MKGGQSHTYLFYLLLVVIFAFLIGMFLVIMSNKITSNYEKFSSAAFIEDFKSKLAGISYGERRVLDFSVPNSVKRICFFDKNPLPTDYPVSEEDYTIEYKERFSNNETNVAFEKGGIDKALDILPNMRVFGRYMQCFATQGNLHIVAEGIGAGEFTVSEE